MFGSKQPDSRSAYKASAVAWWLLINAVMLIAIAMSS
jgi:hypothetical protein